MALELSVCICTFNRAEYIGETLRSIVSQATEAVEIVVVDGGSQDDTEAIVREWQRRFPRIRYQRQKENGGFDRDLAAALDAGQGRYLWMYSDDDPMKPGAIATVLRRLDAGYALVIVNAEVRNRDLTRLLQPRRLRIEHDRVYDPSEMEQLLRDTADYLTFVGAIIMRRDVWQARKKEAWYGTLFVHTAVVFEERLPGPTLVIAEPQVIIRYGQAMWTPRGFAVWMYWWPGVIWALPFSDDAKRAVVGREPWRNLGTLLRHRALGSYSIEEYRSKIADQTRGVARLLSHGIARFPPRILNALLTVGAIVALRGHSTTLIDLLNSRYSIFRRRASRVRSS